jgi:hypothetical protein
LFWMCFGSPLRIRRHRLSLTFGTS